MLHAVVLLLLCTCGCATQDPSYIFKQPREFRKATFLTDAARPKLPIKDSLEHVPAWRKDGTARIVRMHGGSQLVTTIASVDMEVPVTFNKFMEGLMWRQNITDNQGMLFRWNADGALSFWMENTYVGLDIIFARQDGTIVHIGSAHPLSKEQVRSEEKAAYALEVPLGWCERHGVHKGQHLAFDVQPGSFVATFGRNFGASPREVEEARAMGNMDALAS